MKLINQNPYRVVGVFSNATAREVEKQKAKIKAYLRVGKEINSELDFEILESTNRSEQSIAHALANLEQNEDRVINSLFWFLNVNPFDNTAIEYLKNGEDTKAVEIWEKVTKERDVTLKNYSSFNNLGTYFLLKHQKVIIKKGLELKIKLIESQFFKDFTNVVADETYVIDSEKLAKKLVDLILEEFQDKLTCSETIELFSSFNSGVIQYISNKYTAQPIRKIESHIENCKEKRKEEKLYAYDSARNLYVSTKLDLLLLRSILGKDNLKYKSIADSLANEIMQCGIDYFNQKQEIQSSENYLELTKELTKIAASIAVGKLAKDRAKDSLATLEEMKDREVNQAIAILNSIKEAYERACSQIDAEVEKLKYHEFSGVRLHRTDVSINWSKVEKMKEQALDWDKVVEVVSNGISINNVDDIQRSSNQSKVAEYKKLVDFLFGKLGPIQINQVKHLCYWKDVRATQATATAKKVSSTISSATGKGGCYIATMAYGDYDHPQVLELRKFRDDFLIKTMLGRSFIKLYYKYSPSLVQRLKNKQNINLIIRKGLDQFIKKIKK